MYSKDGCLLLSGSSASLLPFNGNNLNILRDENAAADESLLDLRAAVVHSQSSTVNTICWTTGSAHGGHDQQHRSQVKCTKKSTDRSCSNSTAFVLQAMWIRSNETKSLCLVVATIDAIQVYDENGQELSSWSPIKQPNDASSSSLRVFAVLRDSCLAVGLENGDIQLLSAEKRLMACEDGIIKSDHAVSVLSLVADSRSERLANGGDDGRILVHAANAPHNRIQSFEGYGFPCCGIVFWKDMIVAAYGSGHLRLFDISAGTITSEITAHVGWITGIDGAEDAGLVLSTSEDSFVRVWQLCSSRDQESPVALMFSECIPDVRLCGGRFLQSDGRKFALTGYEQEEIMCYSM